MCVCVCVGVCNCVCMCGCDCVGEEGSVWVGQPQRGVRGRGECVCVDVHVCVIVWACVGVIAWVRKGMCGCCHKV